MTMALTETEILQRVLYRDGLMLIIDKPAGIPVHAGPGGGETLEHAFQYLRFGLPGMPALAHRLDRDTSGCLVLGRHHKALAKLGRLFSGGQVEKTYWAIVHGRPPQDAGIIDLPLEKRSTAKRGWWMQVDPAGKSAVTEYKVLAHANGFSWLQLHPKTGRTHQIRVHCAAVGCPLLGDQVYGKQNDHQGHSLQLHARSIVLPLYPKRPPIVVQAEPETTMQMILGSMGIKQPY